MAQKKAYEVEAVCRNLPAGFSIFLLYGPNRGLVAARCKKIALLTRIPLDDPFASTFLEASLLESSPLALLEQTSQLGLLGSNRLIWVKEASNQKGLITAVKDLIQQPPEGSYVILQAKDLPKTSSLRKIIEAAPKTALALPCFQDQPKDIEQLLQKFLQKFSLKISSEAASFLKQHLGIDHLAAAAEIEKLCLYCLHKKQITAQDVQEAVCDLEPDLLEKLIAAIMLGEMQNFNGIFDKYNSLGNNLFILLYSLQKDFFTLQKLKSKIESEMLPSERALATIQPPIFFKRQPLFRAALSLWNREIILKTLAELEQTILDSRKLTNLSNMVVYQYLLKITQRAEKLKRSL